MHDELLNTDQTPKANVIAECSGTIVPTYFGGPMTNNATDHFNNRSADMALFVTEAGVFFNNTGLKTRGRLWFENWFRYGVFADGSIDDMNRWSGFIPVQGWRYAGSTIGNAAYAADGAGSRGRYFTLQLFNLCRSVRRERKHRRRTEIASTGDQ